MTSRSRVNWSELRPRVMMRDLLQAYVRTAPNVPWRTWSTTASPCVARFLDPNGSGPCSGVLTLDHVRDHAMMGKKAPDDEQHLVTLCEAHHLWTRAGRNWATSHRPLLRTYLKEIYQHEQRSDPSAGG